MGGVIWITRKSGPPQENSAVQVSYKKKWRLFDKAKFLELKMLYLRTYDDDYIDDALLWYQWEILDYSWQRIVRNTRGSGLLRDISIQSVQRDKWDLRCLGMLLNTGDVKPRTLAQIYKVSEEPITSLFRVEH